MTPTTHSIFFGLIIWNLLVFVLYAVDKVKAHFQLWRISERSLLIATLFLGGMGALLGIYLCRHKINKSIFPAIAFLSSLFIITLIGFLTQ